MTRPETRYTWSGDYSIAYQVVGDGPVDLVYLPDVVSNVVLNWELAEHARFMHRLASFSRLIVMDRRGVGCSDRLPPGEAPQLEAMVDDVLAVMAASSSPLAALYGGGKNAFTAMLAAASYPERVQRLILFSAAPTWIRSDELPWQASKEDVQQELRMFQRMVSLDEWAGTWVRNYAQSLIGDARALSWFAACAAVTAGAGAWMAEVDVLSRVDLRELLSAIRVPTLILHRTLDPTEPIESARYLAERIPNATLVELPGEDALPWLGEQDAVLDAIEEFLTGTRPVPVSDRALVTVLVTDIVGSTDRAAALGDRAWTELVAAHHDRVRAELGRHRGREIDTAGDGFLAVFDGPERGVRCALAISEAVRELGIEVRAGLHTGEVELDGDAVRGIAVHTCARVAAIASAGQILVSHTVRELVAGSGLGFDDLGVHSLKGVPGEWRLYSVSA